MQPLAALPPEVACGLRGVFTDIDDTLTTDGKLGAAAYAALWELGRAGLHVIPVTGRPAGWCDLVVRQWPVAGVIGENGALAFYEEDGKLERLLHPAVADPAVRRRLLEVERAVLAEVPGARVAKDQAFRLYDLAIDFREEAPDLGFDAATRIAAVFARHGARAKVSSIHVNGWFGDYDKLSMMHLFVRQRFGADLEAERERWIFVGDSPNDEPAFGFFPHACGVANVRTFADRMTHLPRYVAGARGGDGFAEIAAAVLARRRA
jgi:1,2-diacylglycerol 3-alpha-glucosyltransferase